MNRIGSTLVFGIATCSLTEHAHAHHSIANVYDSKRQETVEGTVSEFRFVNPHPVLVIDVAADGVEPELWQLEMDNRSELAEIGVTATTFRPGDRVIVRGSLARNEAHSLYLLRLDRAAD